MAKGILSFLFTNKDASVETGSKNDGKGIAELVGMSNIEASNQIKISKDKGDVKGEHFSSPEQKTVNNKKRKDNRKENIAFSSNRSAQNKHKRHHHNHLRKRHIEINDRQMKAEINIHKANASTLNKKNKITAIKEFLNQLPSDTKDLIEQQIRQKVNAAKNEDKYSIQKKQKTQEQISKRELLERKRGIYRQERTALQLAKLAAEKARTLVKAVRDRVLRKIKPQKNNLMQPNNQNGRTFSLQKAERKQQQIMQNRDR